jgi:hypothetical protein
VLAPKIITCGLNNWPAGQRHLSAPIAASAEPGHTRRNTANGNAKACSQEGGATPLSDARQVLKTIDPPVREEFSRRGWMLVHNFDAEFRSPWQEVSTLSRDAQES